MELVMFEEIKDAIEELENKIEMHLIVYSLKIRRAKYYYNYF